MRLFLGIPSSGSPTKPFLDSLANLNIPSDVSSFDRAVVTGNYVPAQRELIVRRAIERGADRLLMCDDDMVLPADSLAKLNTVLNAVPECALVGALYYSRDGFRPMVVDGWNSNDTTNAHIPAFSDAPIRVDAVGFGCVLLNLTSVHTIERPYFSAQIYIEPQASSVRVCNEDYLFCERLRENGFGVMLEAGVRCGHYDRLSGRTFPERWEDDKVTSQPRMAVMTQGGHALIPVAPAERSNELHEEAGIEYIWAGEKFEVR